MDFSANDFNICRFIRENQPQSKSELHKNFPDCEARLKKLLAEKYIDYYFDGEKFHADKFVLRDKGLLALQDYETKQAQDRKNFRWEIFKLSLAAALGYLAKAAIDFFF